LIASIAKADVILSELSSVLTVGSLY
jgi:hypothetical protein